MKPNRNLLLAATGIFGLLLGLALAPSQRKPGHQIHPTSAGLPQTAKSPDPSPDDPKTNLRTRVRERVEDKKPKEPRVSIPLKTLVQVLKKGELSYWSQFDRLQDCMDKSLTLLGATENEKEEIMNLIEKSKSEILAAEQSHLKLGEATDNVIHMDTSGMRRPVDEVTGRFKDGIRAALPNDLAESLIESIEWNHYYPIDSYTRLEIDRGRTGKLTAWERNISGGSGNPIDSNFKDDGTPLPAELIFKDRWKPFLKGVTILPKDEE